jgi:hypothetical protein
LRVWFDPAAECWRVDMAKAIGAALIIWLLWIDVARGSGALLFIVAYPVLSLSLLHGSPWLGLPIVDTQL